LVLLAWQARLLLGVRPAWIATGLAAVAGCGRGAHDGARAARSNPPAPRTPVTVSACSAGLGDTARWSLDDGGGGSVARGGPIRLAVYPKLCLDLICVLDPCVGGPDPQGIVWWGPSAIVVPCATANATFRRFENGSIGASTSATPPSALYSGGAHAPGTAANASQPAYP
jgi:hypothetical protein